MRVNLQPAYVLHRRPYRDTSFLLDIVTPEYGRVGLVARGARRLSRGASKAALLQPFQPLLVSFSGRSELKTLVAAEAAKAPPPLNGDRLLSGIYINELVVRLLHRNDAHPLLFAAYGAALEALGGNAPVDVVLRRFELSLLENLGYRLELDVDAVSHQRVREDRCYRFEPGVGLVACGEVREGRESVFGGGELLAMAAGEFGGAARPVAKRLLREALAVHLGDRPLRSRELFLAPVMAGSGQDASSI